VRKYRVLAMSSGGVLTLRDDGFAATPREAIGVANLPDQVQLQAHASTLIEAFHIREKVSVAIRAYTNPCGPGHLCSVHCSDLPICPSYLYHADAAAADVLMHPRLRRRCLCASQLVRDVTNDGFAFNFMVSD
jgi:hypothetical protein